jgi:hypothetical protein
MLLDQMPYLRCHLCAIPAHEEQRPERPIQILPDRPGIKVGVEFGHNGAEACISLRSEATSCDMAFSSPMRLSPMVSLADSKGPVRHKRT